MNPSVKAVALGVVVKDGHVLTSRLAARLGAGRPLRPIGGFIEFGERAAEAVVREYREELGREVEVVRLLEVYEHLFEFPAISGHEIVFLLELRFAAGHGPPDLGPLSRYEQDAAVGARHDKAEWVSLTEILAGAHEVYPPDLAAKLRPLAR